MKRILMKSLLISIFIVFITSSLTFAQQNDKDLVLKQIETLFDGMRAGDSSAVASVFVKEATMHSIFKNQEGETILNPGSLASFKNAVGTPHDQVWDERVANIKIYIDGDLAVAWVPYSFYAGDNFSHCGVNSFQFMRTKSGWKSISIVDTRRRTNCAEGL
ncbi:MAG: nuclear transport factor 2 family protein [Balneola sp.]